jgi:murein DD-endopeptidase MepM/ murein hydrolase activator NlpD
MPEMPTLGPPQKSSPVIPVAITAVVVGLLAGGIFWLRSGSEPAAEPQEVAAAPESPAPAPAVEPPPAAAPPVGEVESKGPRTFTAIINGPLESAVVGAVGKEHGTALTQVVNRSLVWWVRVPQDLVKGDTLSVIYEPRDGQEPLVHAVRFTSRKHGRTFEAFRFKPAGNQFARFYQADGSELEEHLVDGPLEAWEQITSLLRDGRKHKGVDFKAPVGTPVKAPFDGVITRKNWNFRGNGNSIELEETGGQGRTALFLHLSELPKSLAVGQRLKKGEVFAKSGNTGRSFAPHLHYQLMKGDKVLDPFESHATLRRSVPPSDRAAFEAERQRLAAELPRTELAGG